MWENLSASLPTIMTTISAVILGWFSWNQKTKTDTLKAQAAEDAINLARKTEDRQLIFNLLEQYQQEVNEIRRRYGADIHTLTVRLAQASARINYLELGINQLISQMRDSGVQPIFIPNGEYKDKDIDKGIESLGEDESF